MIIFRILACKVWLSSEFRFAKLDYLQNSDLQNLIIFRILVQWTLLMPKKGKEKYGRLRMKIFLQYRRLLHFNIIVFLYWSVMAAGLLYLSTHNYIFIFQRKHGRLHIKKLQYRRLCNYTSMNVVLLSIGDGSGALQHTIIFMYYIIITIWVKELHKEMCFYFR